MTWVFFALLVQLVCTLIPAPPVGGDVCFFVADNDGRERVADVLTMWDPVEDSERVIGTTGTTLVEAIAVDPYYGVLYAADAGTLGTLDIVSGDFCEIGDIGNGIGVFGRKHFTDIDGMSFDPTTGVLYGTVRKEHSSLLVQINSETGSIVDHAFGIALDYVPIEPLDEGFSIDDIAVHPQNGSLYAVASKTDSPSRLLSINKFTGAATAMTVLDVSDVEGLSFDAGHELIGTTGDDGRAALTIDMATGQTAVRNKLGASGNRDYESIACSTGLHERPSFEPSDSRTPGDILTLESYPNPTSDRATIRFTTSKTLRIEVGLFDVLGRQKLTVAEGLVSPGESRWPLNVGSLEPGVYFVRAQTRIQRRTLKVLVVR